MKFITIILFILTMFIYGCIIPSNYTKTRYYDTKNRQTGDSIDYENNRTTYYYDNEGRLIGSSRKDH